jgi:uncharacterized protein YndB with AHSA1/START domain
VVDALDPRPGGAWRFVNRTDDGTAYVHFGVYHAVTPERIVQTYELEGMGSVGLVTLTIEEHDGRTTITETTLFPSVEDRDGVIESGMEGGAAESMDRLDELLKTL